MMAALARRLALVVACVPALTAAAAAQGPTRIRIAVADPDPAPAGLSAAEARVTGDLVRQFLAELPDVVVLERERMAEVFRDRAQADRMPGVYDRTTAVEMGRVLEASHVAYGGFDRPGGMTQLYYNVVDVGTTAMAAGATVRWSTEAGRDSALRVLAGDLGEELRSWAGRTAAPAPTASGRPALVTVPSDFPFHVDSSWPGPAPRSRMVPAGTRVLTAVTLGGTTVRAPFQAVAGFAAVAVPAIPRSELRQIGAGAVLGERGAAEVRGFGALGPDVLVVDGNGRLSRVSAYGFDRRWYNGDCDFAGPLVVADSFAFATATVKVSVQRGPYDSSETVEVPTICAIRLKDGAFAGELLRGVQRVWRTPGGVGVLHPGAMATFFDGGTLARRQVDLAGAPALDPGFALLAGPVLLVREQSTGTLYGYESETGTYLWKRPMAVGTAIHVSGDRIVAQGGAGEALVLNPASGAQLASVRHGLSRVDFLSGSDGRVAACAVSGSYALFDVFGELVAGGVVDTGDRGYLEHCELEENGRLFVVSGRSRIALFDPGVEQPVLAFEPEHGIRSVSRARGLAVVLTGRGELVSLGLVSNPWFFGWTRPVGSRQGLVLRLAHLPAPADSVVHAGPASLDGMLAGIDPGRVTDASLRVTGPWSAEIVRAHPPGAEAVVALSRGRVRAELDAEGGDLWIDGYFLGPAADTRFSVAPGVHRVRIERAGLVLLDTLVSVGPGENPPLLPVSPREREATVAFRAWPRDGSIYVDGALIDRAQPSLRAQPGTILNVEVRRLGFRTTYSRFVVPDAAIDVREYSLESAEPRLTGWISATADVGSDPPVSSWDAADLTPDGPLGAPRRVASAGGIDAGGTLQYRYGRLLGILKADLSAGTEVEGSVSGGAAVRILPLTRRQISADVGISLAGVHQAQFSRHHYSGPLHVPFTEQRNQPRVYANVDLALRLGAARFLSLSAGRLSGGDLRGLPVVQTVAGEGENNEGAEYEADEERAYRIRASHGFRAEALYTARLGDGRWGPFLQLGARYTQTDYDYRVEDEALRQRSWRVKVGLAAVGFRPT